MKKLLAILLTSAMTFSLVACGGNKGAQDNTLNEQVAAEKTVDESDPAALLDAITNDFTDVTTALTEKQTETFSAVGTTYADYQKNKGLIDTWMESVLSESDELFARTKENSVAYFKLIVANEDHVYSEFCDDALDKYYDTVYDKAMDTYYDALYDDAMDALYDQYYDGIISDVYDTVEYKEWSDANSECYKTWSDASSNVYKKWSKESSYVYGLWSAMSSALCYNKNYDVDAIVAEYDKEKDEQDAKQAEKDAKVYTDLEVLYEINADGNAEVVGYTGEGNRITISSEYEGKDVVRIADAAFEGCTTLEDVINWADIEEIGDSAFAGCTGLTDFSIPNDTKVIGGHAFEGCTNLENLVIWGDPDIGEYAFSDCSSLAKISIGSDTKNVGAHAFENCTSATSLIIWGADIIGDYAFAGCTGIEEVSIPSDVRSIGNHAFDGCTALSSVIIWDDDTAIGKDVFANCPSLSDAPYERGTVLECTMSGSENGGDDTKANANEPTQSEATTDGIRPEFKEAMDSYEAFYTEYCDFLKQYKEKPTDSALLAKYSTMLVKADEMNKAFEAWNEDDLSNEEMKYYLDVNNRVMKMLVDVAD